MPHRVVNFLRASTENISIKSSATRARNTRDHPLVRQTPYAASLFDGDDIARMHDGEQHGFHKKHHRLSFSFGRASKDMHEVAGASLDWNIESPPVLFLGDTENSTGALVSGQMCLEVTEETLAVDSFEASLNVHVLQKKPFQNHCTECANQYAEIKHWTFLSHPTVLRKGKHLYPFSVLLGGHLPASLDSPLMSISYEFKAEVHVSQNPTSSTGSIVPIKFERVLDVKRALPESELPHHSVRVFPPTNIKTSAHYTQVINPTGTSNISMRLDGITNKNEKNKTIEFWRLKKITWRLEETIKTVAPACEKHSPSGGEAGSKKGVQRVETRTLGEKSLTDGWKSDYLTNDGTIEFELDYGVLQQKHHHGGSLRYACDSKSRDGTEVSHSLMIELVVSREWSPVGRPQLLTQTGTGRILRMHYQVSLTEPSGLGVSWDNESPPIYQDVPPSPPAYPDQVCPIDYESLEPLDAARDSDGEQ